MVAHFHTTPVKTRPDSRLAECQLVGSNEGASQAPQMSGLNAHGFCCLKLRPTTMRRYQLRPAVGRKGALSRSSASLSRDSPVETTNAPPIRTRMTSQASSLVELEEGFFETHFNKYQLFMRLSHANNVYSPRSGRGCCRWMVSQKLMERGRERLGLGL